MDNQEKNLKCSKRQIFWKRTAYNLSNSKTVRIIRMQDFRMLVKVTTNQGNLNRLKAVIEKGSKRK